MLSMEKTASQQEFLDIITFPYDDETKRHLISFYKYKETLLDPDLIHEHLVNQPVLGVALLFLSFVGSSIFLFSVVFISCRALGKCGAKRYQVEKRAAFKQQSVFDLFDDIDYDGDFEQLPIKSTTTSPPFVTAATTKKLEDMIPVPIGLSGGSKRNTHSDVNNKSSDSAPNPPVITLPIRPIPKDNRVIRPLTTVSVFMETPDAQRNNVEFDEQTLLKTLASDNIENTKNIIVLKEDQNLTVHNNSISDEELEESAELRNSTTIATSEERKDQMMDTRVTKPLIRFPTRTSTETTTTLNLQTTIKLITIDRTKVRTTKSTTVLINDVTPTPTTTEATPSKTVIDTTTPNPITTSTTSTILPKFIMDKALLSKSIEDEAKLDVNFMDEDEKTTVKPPLQRTKSWTTFRTQPLPVDSDKHDDDEGEKDFSKNIVDDTAFMAIASDPSQSSSKENHVKEIKDDGWTLQESTIYPLISRGLWIACLLFSLSSVPIVFSLFKLSKYYLRMKTEYYWTLAENYGTLRPKRVNSEGIYGNIYGSLRIKRSTSRPPQSQPIYAESPIYSDGPIYGAYGAYGRI
uniref:Mucin-5AC-like n=1 Tax=Heterorhabditis bacteriophora TaxID=37862 RepID=A0A1I7XIK8_HETBA